MKKIISLLTIILIVVSLLVSIFNVRFWDKEGQVIKWDVLEYYGYLPSAFIYHDLSLKFTEDPPEDWGKRIWVLTAPNGNKVFKMTMGMSVMYAPFFAMGHGWAILTGLPADGYSNPYKFALLMSSVFYLFFGLFFLRKILLLYFSDGITALTLFAIVAGTNLWYYGSFEAPMSHAYSFSLFAVFLWLTICFYRNPEYSTAIWMGLVFGLITLIRPSNGILVLVFVFYNISRFSDLWARASFLISRFDKILLISGFAIFVWIPQLLYWHMQTGDWFYFSYAENGAFYFTDPQVIKGLFSYRKGWFIYTPLMFLAVLAIPLTWKYARSFTLPLTIFVPLNIYIVFSWWCWWYGGCFGQRALIDSYVLMAIPLASMIRWLFMQATWKKISITALLTLSILLSMMHTAQYYYGAIHWDSMTRKAYWYSFGKIRPGPDFQKLLDTPDYDKALRGEEE